MTDMFSDDRERAESYRLLADLFLRAPDDADLSVLRKDFDLKAGESAESVGKEYELLFSFPLGRLQPVASLYADAGFTSMDDITGFYLRAGLVLDDHYGLPADHIVTELLFMSYLIDTHQDSLQKNFLEQHLLNWVPYFCEEVTLRAETVFYREISGILKEFLLSEHEEFPD